MNFVKISTFVVLALLTACKTSRLYDTTVSVTNLERTSGGSGTILSSTPNLSFVLTNSHVCEVTRSGGLVNKENGNSFFVQAFKRSMTHDLCIIAVAADLHAESSIAKESPLPLEESTVSGHPRLLPLIINKGHFSGKSIIQVMTGLRPCTEEEFKNGKTGVFCMLIGKLPVVKTYEAQTVSNLIQPGSSGSAVYNTKGEISAVIFAGSGDIGYGFAVPFEFLSQFLDKELPTLPVEYPDVILKFTDSSTDSRRQYKDKVKELCKSDQTLKDNDLCDLVTSAIVYE